MLATVQTSSPGATHASTATAGTAPCSGVQCTICSRLWIAAGFLCIATGVIGIVVPFLPTTDFLLLAAYSFSRGSRRWEAWLLGHPRFGPVVRDWRATRSVPLRAKWYATAMMLASSGWAAWAFSARTGWIPAAVCLVVGVYLWSRPTSVRA
jgi:uncharacterized protein